MTSWNETAFRATLIEAVPNEVAVSKMPVFLNTALDAAAKAWSFLSGLGFLTGALCGTLITLVVGGLRARRERRISALQEQLRLLYGPVAALANQNQNLFQLTQKIQGAHSKYFGTFDATASEERQAAVLKAAESTTNLGNLYIKRVIENNARVMATIDAGWHLMDASDRAFFSKFQIEYIRYLIEAEQRGTTGVPFNVILDIGGHEIAFMRPEMISGVIQAFEHKRASMEKERSNWL